MAAGGNHNCAVLSDDTVACWGRNEQGQLGDGTTSYHRARPVRVPGLTDVRSVAVGGPEITARSCAVLKDGTVKCWGRSTGKPGGGIQFEPMLVEGLEGVQNLAMGSAHSCALLVDGSVKCWGLNIFGQAGSLVSEDGGSGTAPFIYPPRAIHGLRSVQSIAAGGAHTCAIVKEGALSKLRCWGSSSVGQCAHSSVNEWGMPVSSSHAVPGLENVIWVAAGYYHTCALDRSAGLVCWGLHDCGQTGIIGECLTHDPDACTHAELDPQGVTSVHESCWSSGFVHLSSAFNDVPAGALGGYHSCVVTPDRRVACWGRNDLNQATESTIIVPNDDVPAIVEGVNDVVELVAGSNHACARRESGDVVCWGRNMFGQLGSDAPNDDDGSPPSRVLWD
ncbi:RCC1 domain-containing protein [Sorangium sp. So ce861]|uniref:RCC1 domain-containing protein n=1 Tax=Sorangium sp. So ce861 TaxID=3133323 RepID=UPI003F635007